MDYLRNRPFLVVDYSYRPTAGQRTERKNFKATAEWAVDEKPTIQNRVNEKTLLNSHTVIDILNKKVIRTQFVNEKEEDVYNHFYQKYKDQMDRVSGEHHLRQQVQKPVQFTGDNARYSHLNTESVQGDMDAVS